MISFYHLFHIAGLYAMRAYHNDFGAGCMIFFMKSKCHRKSIQMTNLLFPFIYSRKRWHKEKQEADKKKIRTALFKREKTRRKSRTFYTGMKLKER